MKTLPLTGPYGLLRKESDETPRNSPAANNRAEKHANTLGEIPIFR
jgi:hypothetical protein